MERIADSVVQDERRYQAECERADRLAATSPGFAVPSLNNGEFYSGLILKEDGSPDYHLIGLPGELEATNHADAVAWAKSTGGDLPTCRELNLLRANARQHFKDSWYWSNEQHAAYSYRAWSQLFTDGSQGVNFKDGKLRARAVRRLYIQ